MIDEYKAVDLDILQATPRCYLQSCVTRKWEAIKQLDVNVAGLARAKERGGWFWKRSVHRYTQALYRACIPYVDIKEQELWNDSSLEHIPPDPYKDIQDDPFGMLGKGIGGFLNEVLGFGGALIQESLGIDIDMDKVKKWLLVIIIIIIIFVGTSLGVKIGGLNKD
jgi:hypothetical protein